MNSAAHASSSSSSPSSSAAASVVAPSTITAAAADALAQNEVDDDVVADNTERRVAGRKRSRSEEEEEFEVEVEEAEDAAEKGIGEESSSSSSPLDDDDGNNNAEGVVELANDDDASAADGTPKEDDGNFRRKDDDSKEASDGTNEEGIGRNNDHRVVEGATGEHAEEGAKFETDESGQGVARGGMPKGDIDHDNDAKEAASQGLNGKNEPSIGKRKGQPQKLPSERIGTTMITSQQHQQHQQQQQHQSGSDGANPKKSNNNALNDDGGDYSSSSSDDDESSHHAAIVASLLNGEHGSALRTYLAQMGHPVPPNAPTMHLHFPAPLPSFPSGIADFLKSPQCRSVVVLAGAGMSVSSGIPDFRSAGIGLYDTLRPELLTATELERELIDDDPTLALDKRMFLQNPLPMLETKRSFILGTYEKRWKATLAHRFVELLHSKLGKLTRLYTQNIDGLEAQCTNLPRDKVVNVHGSMGAAACECCGREADFADFCEKVRSNIKDISIQDADAPAESTPIVCDACGNPTVKPTIVLFRGSMPKEFHVKTAADLPECDLLIVMGTSLTVAPANSLVYRVPPTALRMVINNERVGRRLGIDYSESSVRDVFANGHSDETCLELAEEMGWLDDLASIEDELPESSARLLRERLSQLQCPQNEEG